MLWYIIGSVGQWGACVLLASGIAIEIIYRAELGYLAITLGSAVFAIMTKIKAGGKDAAIQRLLDQHDRKRARNTRAGDRKV